MALFEEYKNHPDPFVRERATNWTIAIGLQRVDGLNVSEFLIQVVRQEIEGKITIFFCDFYMDLHYINSVRKVQRNWAISGKKYWL
jgi:hypothetical protein